MTTQHTRGPWVFEPHNGFGRDTGRLGPCPFGYVSTSIPRSPIFALEPIYDNSRKKMVADARLIAAAPELLEELRFAVNLIDEQLDGDFPESLRAMRAVIAKATGQ